MWKDFVFKKGGENWKKRREIIEGRKRQAWEYNLGIQKKNDHFKCGRILFLRKEGETGR